MKELSGEYSDSLTRKTTIQTNVFSGKTTARLKSQFPLHEITNHPPQLTTVVIESDADVNTADLTIQLQETNDIAVGASRDNLGDVVYTDEGATAALGATSSVNNFTLKNTPIRPGTFTISASGGLTATDDGSGAFQTADPSTTGFSGTINYTTGAVVVTLGSTSTAASNTVQFDYTTNSAQTIKPGGRVRFTVYPQKRYLEVKSTSGTGFIRIELDSLIRWDKMAFAKTDTNYPQEILQPETLPAINNT